MSSHEAKANEDPRSPGPKNTQAPKGLERARFKLRAFLLVLRRCCSFLFFFFFRVSLKPACGYERRPSPVILPGFDLGYREAIVISKPNSCGYQTSAGVGRFHLDRKIAGAVP